MGIINTSGKIYGYIRVSTKDQNEDRQVYALMDYGVKPSHIYMDKQTGANFNRPAYKYLIRNVRRGDIIVIKSIDRLGRNYQDVIDQWRLITQDLGVGIHVVDMPTLNTSGDPKDLMSRFITDMMLQVLSFVAETERSTTRARSMEGRKAMTRRGGSCGTPLKISKELWSYYIIWKRKELSVKEICERMHIKPRTWYRRSRIIERDYGDYDVETLEKLIINQEVPIIPKSANNGTEVMFDPEETNVEELPHRLSRLDYYSLFRRDHYNNEIQDGIKPYNATSVNQDEHDSDAFMNEFRKWYSMYWKLRTQGWLMRTRERRKLAEDARLYNMHSLEYLDMVVKNCQQSKYFCQKAKMANDVGFDNPGPLFHSKATKKNKYKKKAYKDIEYIEYDPDKVSIEEVEDPYRDAEYD